MFGSIDSLRVKDGVPEHCSFRPSDWRILASFWHPIAFLRDIRDKPVGVRLLDVDLVVFRTTAGVTVARDICPHRGTQLSKGWLNGDTLVCPMHGLCFNCDGLCTRIPSVRDPKVPVPPGLRLQVVNSVEQMGILFACLSDEPRLAPPNWPELDVAATRVAYTTEEWHTSAARHIENFNDVAHFPWVHVSTFGGDRDDSVASYRVAKTQGGFTFAISNIEPRNRFSDVKAPGARRVTYRYRVTLPFSTIIEVSPDDSDYRQYFADTACPVSSHETKVFQMRTDNSDRPDVERLTAESLAVNGEDRPLVESQYPKDLPLNPLDEAHIPADRMSILYRRALVQLGLGAPVGGVDNGVVEGDACSSTRGEVPQEVE